jgi:hypothetical protein
VALHRTAIFLSREFIVNVFENENMFVGELLCVVRMVVGAYW